MEKNTKLIEEKNTAVVAEQQERANRVLIRIQDILKEENCLLSMMPMVNIDGKQPMIVVLAR